MKAVNESFYNLNEIQPAQERENLLFKDINNYLLVLCPINHLFIFFNYINI